VGIAKEENSLAALSAYRRRLRVFTPFGLSLLSSLAIFIAIYNMAPPTDASGWGSLLSALVALIALGAFTSTIFLQTEELSLQRREISNLAAAAEDQGGSLRRQTVIDSYRIIDEKLSSLWGDETFTHLITSTESPDNAFLIDGLNATGEGVHSISYRGMHNLQAYKFVTGYHKFPITFFKRDSYGGQGEGRSGLVPISQFIVLTGVSEAAGILRHVYDLATDLNLLDYVRSVILRRTQLEPALFIAAKFEYHHDDNIKQSIRISPFENFTSMKPIIDHHVTQKVQFYNPVTAFLAGETISEDIYSPEAELPFATSSALQE
jgi:hypothetical protein